jgi:hypothetical protein
VFRKATMIGALVFVAILSSVFLMLSLKYIVWTREGFEVDRRIKGQVCKSHDQCVSKRCIVPFEEALKAHVDTIEPTKYCT